MAQLFLGIDGGKSSTTALIGDENGRVIGSGRGGPCNHVAESEGRAKFIAAIEGSVSAACDRAGLNFATVRFRSACLGFSGGPADKKSILLEILRCDQLAVTHDALIALVGGTGGEPGLIVIAGTGSISFGRNRAGTTARAGGWGYVFGDEGSAFDIARQALRAALRNEEGWGPPTALREMLLAETGSADMNEALHRFYTPDFPRPRVAMIAKAVDRIAESGDGVAARVLESAAHQLAELASAVRLQLFEPGEDARVAYIGGVFHSTRVRERFRTLVELDPANRVMRPAHGPAAGALLEAYREAGIDVSLSEVPEVEKQ